MTGTTANNSEATLPSAHHIAFHEQRKDSLGNGIGIVIPGPAAEGDEDVGPAVAVLDPLTLEPELDPDDEEGSGGAAMNISFCAPSAKP